MNRFLFIFLLLIAGVSCKAQPPAQLSTKNKRAERAYESATTHAGRYEIPEAISDLEVAKKEDPNFVEAYLLEAELYMQLRNWSKAIDQFKAAFAINPNFFPSAYYECGDAEMKLGRYDDAKKDYQYFLDHHRSGISQSMIDNATQGIANCDFATSSINHPVPFNPLNMGESVNTSDFEYFPNVTADDATFLFTRNKRKTGVDGSIASQEDFYISYKNSDGKWSVAQSLGPPVNTDQNEGAPSLSADGRFLFFAACADDYNGYGMGRQGYGSCDIFYTQHVNGQWAKPVNIGAPVNSSAWETQPSFSSDGKTLYFISNRRGGFGDSDIWMSILGDDGKWSTPVNLGADINTQGREEAVFIHPDNQTLYFASDGHTGMGGLDLFVCRRDSTGKWGKPVNLGYPINTSGDESGLIVNGSGQMAYFSSDREGTMGGDDIYMFNLPKEFQPVPVTYMKGKTYNVKTKNPVGAAFKLIDLGTGKTVITSYSDPGTGAFLVCLPVNHNYALDANAAGFLPYSESFMMKEAPDPNKPFRMDVPLIPLEDSAVFEAKNIFFKTDMYNLEPESKAELNQIIAWMKANPKVKLEISGHTDNVGDKKHNITLSTNRAKSVYDYLVANGIEAARLTYKGYGDTKPKVANDTPEHRQMNRRTEFKVISTK